MDSYSLELNSEKAYGNRAVMAPIKRMQAVRCSAVSSEKFMQPSTFSLLTCGDRTLSGSSREQPPFHRSDQ